jgi:hypothetical protein
MTLPEFIADYNSKLSVSLGNWTVVIRQKIPEDLDHWKTIGITTAEEADKFLHFAGVANAYRYLTEKLMGVRPGWDDVLVLSMEELRARVASLKSLEASMDELDAYTAEALANIETAEGLEDRGRDLEEFGRGFMAKPNHGTLSSLHGETGIFA